MSLPLVDRVALGVWRQWRCRVELDELKAVGRAALVTLLRDYDAERSPLFPYLAPRLRWAMFDELRAQTHCRTSVHQRARCPGHRSAWPRIRPTDARVDPRWSRGPRGSGDGIAAPAGPGPAAPAGDLAAVVAACHNPEAALLRKSERAQVRRAVAELPPWERSLIEGHYLGGRRFDEIARQLGISKGWASRLHHRALARLRRRLTLAQPPTNVAHAGGPQLASTQDSSPPSYSEAA